MSTLSDLDTRCGPPVAEDHVPTRPYVPLRHKSLADVVRGNAGYDQNDIELMKRIARQEFVANPLRSPVGNKDTIIKYHVRRKRIAQKTAQNHPDFYKP